MKSHLLSARGRKTLLGLTALAATAAAVFGLTRNSSTQEKPRRLPPIVSQVKSVEVVSARVVNEGGPFEHIQIEVRNTTDRDIISLGVESGDSKDSAAIHKNGFSAEPPQVVLPAHGTMTIEYPWTSVMKGHPLRVAAVIYADNEEEGDELALGSMRRSREQARAKAAEKKAAEEKGARP